MFHAILCIRELSLFFFFHVTHLKLKGVGHWLKKSTLGCVVVIEMELF